MGSSVRPSVRPILRHSLVAAQFSRDFDETFQLLSPTLFEGTIGMGSSFSPSINPSVRP